MLIFLSHLGVALAGFSLSFGTAYGIAGGLTEFTCYGRLFIRHVRQMFVLGLVCGVVLAFATLMFVVYGRDSIHITLWCSCLVGNIVALICLLMGDDE